MGHVIRFINSTTRKVNQLSLTWTYPGCDEFQGAQVLGISEGIDIAVEKDHGCDDWFSASSHTHMAIIEVTDCTGDSGPLPYRAIVESDVVAMHVISLDDSDFAWAMQEIAWDLVEEGHDIDADDKSWWEEVASDEVIARLIKKSRKVSPEWVELF